MADAVVVTGMGVASPLGADLDTASEALREGKHGIRVMPDWADVAQLATRLGAPALPETLKYPRKQVRGMGRVGLLSTYATEQALSQAGLSRDDVRSPRLGLAYGSTAGSSTALEHWSSKVFQQRGLGGVVSTDFLKLMSHTCAANLATYFGIVGRVVPTCAACVSSSQAIGVGYESILAGKADVMLCGGAEEMHFMNAGVFDLMYAASSKYNDAPDRAPRPFDLHRDGLVVGEGAGTLVLERESHARARGAEILARVGGYATNCDGSHVTNPSAEGMAQVMRQALVDARLDAADIDYVNAHATATEVGDIAESQATLQVLGRNTPVSSTKSYTGHTLGACGALEAAFCVRMLREGWIAANRNLEEVDPRCAPLNYLRETREQRLRHVLSNNFAFGGINTSLVLSAV